MPPGRVEIVAASDRALLACFGRRISATASERVAAALAAVLAAPPAGVINLHPAYASLLVDFDPAATDAASLAAALRALLDAVLPAPPSPRRIVLPVVYGGSAGPDLAEVAAGAGLTSAEAAALHARARYRVAFLGFSPGFPYLRGLPARLATARRASPRPRVPAGSVAIAGGQAGVYPVATPGGWCLIGRTGERLFDPSLAAPARLAIGDEVRFRAAARGEEGAGDSPACSRTTMECEGGTVRLEVVTPGLGASIQDLGRLGHAHLGVSACGAADPCALTVGNWLVGNAAGAAAVEITLGGAVIRFVRPCRIALAGGDAEARLAGRSVEPWVSTVAPAGAVLTCGRIRGGARVYLCVTGGIAVPAVLGSRATHAPSALGGVAGRRLEAGDLLAVAPPPPDRPVRRAPSALVAALYPAGALRVTPGADAAAFAGETLAALTATNWRVAPESDRIGLRLDGTRLGWWRDGEMVSTGVPLGVIQVPPGGQPIILFVDHQTTGGYPQLAGVVAADLHRLGQLAPGDGVRFERVSLTTAARLRAGRDAVMCRIREILP